MTGSSQLDMPSILSNDREAPADLLDLFLSRIQRGDGVPEWMRAALWDCEDVVPAWTCDNLGVPRGSTVGESVRQLHRREREARS